MNKKELINYINNLLKIEDFSDSSKNWLQIDNRKEEIKKIGYAVDATTYIFEKAVKENVDLLLVHHGIFWWFEQVLVDIPYKRAQIMIENNIALAWYHLPLDAHEIVWNNIWLLENFVNIFNIKNYEKERFAIYKWQEIGFGIRFENEIDINDILNIYCEKVDLQKNLYNFWNKKKIKSVAFCSGWAWDLVQEAKNKNYDLYITGEAAHFQITFAKELWQSILLAWHYETEKIGPKLLAEHLKEKFGLEIIYIDEKY